MIVICDEHSDSGGRKVAVYYAAGGPPCPLCEAGRRLVYIERLETLLAQAREKADRAQTERASATARANSLAERVEELRLESLFAADVFRDVAEFHRKFGCAIGERPAFPDEQTVELRRKLLREEFRETIDALDESDLVGFADGLADLIYVAVGAALACGIPLADVWREVHAANMRKEGGPTRADGKILKPEGWQPPDVAGVLERAKEK